MTSLSDAERLAWLRLARTENVGPVTFEQLVGRYGSASKALAALPELSRRGGRIKPLTVPSESDALAELERVTREIQQHTKAIADLQEEGRKAGAPAGWLR